MRNVAATTIVFLSGVAIMVLEIVGVRLLARDFQNHHTSRAPLLDGPGNLPVTANPLHKEPGGIRLIPALEYGVEYDGIIGLDCTVEQAHGLEADHLMHGSNRGLDLGLARVLLFATSSTTTFP